MTIISTDRSPAFRANLVKRFDCNPEEVVLIYGNQEADYLTFLGQSQDGNSSIGVPPAYQFLATQDHVAESVEHCDLS